MSYTQMTAATLAAAMRSGELSASDIARDHLQRITAVDGNLSAFCETFAERVTSRAAAIDQKQAAGETLGAKTIY
jgi:aspartyl-tRNA(Asn)/glutamyl-tRNA(Gln) amidotransferase subunit A